MLLWLHKTAVNYFWSICMSNYGNNLKLSFIVGPHFFVLKQRCTLIIWEHTKPALPSKLCLAAVGKWSICKKTTNLREHKGPPAPTHLVFQNLHCKSHLIAQAKIQLVALFVLRNMLTSTWVNNRRKGLPFYCTFWHDLIRLIKRGDYLGSKIFCSPAPFSYTWIDMLGIF